AECISAYFCKKVFKGLLLVCVTEDYMFRTRINHHAVAIMLFCRHSPHTGAMLSWKSYLFSTHTSTNICKHRHAKHSFTLKHFIIISCFYGNQCHLCLSLHGY
ncbi:hypothetical protein ILYODFUR_006408, partial [Ilyodon furcidens]